MVRKKGSFRAKLKSVPQFFLHSSYFISKNVQHFGDGSRSGNQVSLFPKPVSLFFRVKG